MVDIWCQSTNNNQPQLTVYFSQLVLWSAFCTLVTGTKTTIPITDPIMLWTRLTFTAKGKTQMKKSGYHTQQVIRKTDTLLEANSPKNMCWHSITVKPSSVHIQHNCEKPWSNWNKLHLVQSILQAAEINKALAHLLLEELELVVAAQFKQESITNVLGHSTISQQSPHTLQLVWVLTTSWVSTNGKADLREDVPLSTKLLACDNKSGNSETVDDSKNGCML